MSLVSLDLQSNFPLLPKQNIWQFDRETTILVETFGTLCVSGDKNAIQSVPSPHPPWTVLGVYKSITFYLFCTG